MACRLQSISAFGLPKRNLSPRASSVRPPSVYQAKPNLLWGPGNWVGLDRILPSLTLPRADAASAANHQVPVGTAWLGDRHKAWEPHEQRPALKAASPSSVSFQRVALELLRSSFQTGGPEKFTIKIRNNFMWRRN